MNTHIRQPIRAKPLKSPSLLSLLTHWSSKYKRPIRIIMPNHPKLITALYLNFVKKSRKKLRCKCLIRQ